MSLNRRIAGFVVAAAMLAGGSAVFAQTTTEPGTQADQQQGMMPGQDMDGMRSMMREMMQDMMREQGMGPPRAGEDDEEGGFWWRGDGRPWGRGPMTGGGPGGYEGHRGMGPDFAHGPGLRITMALMDTDGDGGVSLDEVQTFHARVFKLVDANADGKLTHEEVRSFFRSSSE